MSNEFVSMRTFQLQSAVHRAVLKQIIQGLDLNINGKEVLSESSITIKKDDPNASAELAFIQAELSGILD